MNWIDKKQVAKYQREWRRKNHNKAISYVSKYRKAHKKELSIKCMKWQKNHPWYGRYYSIKYRCEDKNNTHYKYYGAKGIKCLITTDDLKKLWFRDKAYLLQKPSVDRRNPNGHYEYSNCRFIELSLNNSLAWTGRKHTEVTKNKIRIAMQGKEMKATQGKKHWNYKHGRYIK